MKLPFTTTTHSCWHHDSRENLVCWTSSRLQSTSCFFPSIHTLSFCMFNWWMDVKDLFICKKCLLGLSLSKTTQESLAAWQTLQSCITADHLHRNSFECWKMESILTILLTDSSINVKFLCDITTTSACPWLIFLWADHSVDCCYVSCIHAVLGLLLPGFRFTAEPVLWNCWQIAFTVHNFHPFSGYDEKIALYPLPCSHNVWIHILSSCETFPMFIQACSILLRLGCVPYTTQLQHNHLSVLMMKLL